MSLTPFPKAFGVTRIAILRANLTLYRHQGGGKYKIISLF